MNNPDLVLTQAEDIDGCRTQRRPCSRVKEENVSPLSDKELEGAACVDFLEVLFCLNNLLVWTPWPVRITSCKQLLQLNEFPPGFPEILVNLQVHSEEQEWTQGTEGATSVTPRAISCWLWASFPGWCKYWYTQNWNNPIVTLLHTDGKALFWYQNWFSKGTLCHCGLCVLYFFTRNFVYFISLLGPTRNTRIMCVTAQNTCKAHILCVFYEKRFSWRNNYKNMHCQSNFQWIFLNYSLISANKNSTCSVIFIWVYSLLFLSYKQELWSRVSSLDAIDSMK